MLLLGLKVMELTFGRHQRGGGGGWRQRGGRVQPLVAEAKAVSVQRLGTCRKQRSSLGDF